jgi:hypothetical protein
MRFPQYLLASALATIALLPAIGQRVTTASPRDAIPSRIILTWDGDPAHTQAVSWRTEAPLKSPQAQIAPLTADPSFEKESTTVSGTSDIDHLQDGRAAGHYAVSFTGLKAGTKYSYRVGNGEVWSEWNVFRTADDKPAAFRFLYLGDAQNSIKSLWSRTIRTAYSTAPDARFVVHAGDLVAEGHDDRLWGEWSDAMSFISAVLPSLPVPGNHDLHRPPGDPSAKSVLGAPLLWRRHFVLPANGPDIEEMKSQSYYLDYQGVRFVAIDVNAFANEDFQADARKRVQEKEVAWLESVLKNNPNRWTIVVQHQPIYAIAKGREYSEMRATLAPLYEKYKVDLVLQGHDHAYARTHKVAKDRVTGSAYPGVVYAISVSGPKMYQTHESHRELMATVVEQRQCFQAVKVSPDRLMYAAYSIDGALVDSFELQKKGAGTLYTNHAPASKRPSSFRKSGS